MWVERTRGPGHWGHSQVGSKGRGFRNEAVPPEQSQHSIFEFGIEDEVRDGLDCLWPSAMHCCRHELDWVRVVREGP